MGKFILQLAIFAALFFLMWFGLSQIPWVKKFNIEQFTKEKQEQLSELVLKIHKLEKAEVYDAEILDALDNIKNIICRANNIDTNDVTLHVFEDKMINAFALPGGHIVVNTELINYCDNADMLAGVMAHEMAHVQLQHVSRKLAREIGVSTLIMLTGGGEHLGTLKEVLYTLSSRGFDRDLEREADAQAIVYMKNAKGDAKQLAVFLKKLSAENNTDLPEVLKWVSTHPDAQERVRAILAKTKGKYDTAELIPPAQWSALKDEVKKLESTN